MSCSIINNIQRDLNIELDDNNEYVVSDNQLLEVYNWVEKTNNGLRMEGFDLPYLNFNNNTLFVDKQYEDLYLNHESNMNLMQLGENDFNPDADNSLGTEVITENDIVDNPKNFLEWEQTVRATLKKLKQLQSGYRKIKNQFKASEVKKSIKFLEDQLKKFNANDVTVVHASLIKEIENLNNIMNIINNDKNNALDLIESNAVRKRIDNLLIYFLGSSLDNYNPDVNEMKKTLENSLQGNPEKYEEVIAKITKLKENYIDLLPKIVENIFQNNELVEQQKLELIDKPSNKKLFRNNNNAWEDFEMTAKAIIDPEYRRQQELRPENNGGKKSDFLTDVEDRTYIQSINKLEARLLPANLIDSLYAQLSSSSKSFFGQQETGYLSEEYDRLKNAWDKLSNIAKDITKNKNILGINYKGSISVSELVGRLYQKDVFGERTSKLISPYTQLIKKLKETQYIYKEYFLNNRSSDTYKSFMNYNKSNFEILEPYKLLSFYNKHKNNKLYKDFFIYSEAEMQQYETKMIAKYGKANFTSEVKKLDEKISDFTFEQNGNVFMCVMDAYDKNPYNFIKRFYSDDYNKADESTGSFIEDTFVTMIPKESKYFNEDFRKIEDGEYGAELMEYYEAENEILNNYLIPHLQANGVFVEENELPNLKDVWNAEAMATATVKQKISRAMMNVWKTFTDKSVQSQDDQNQARLDKKLGKKVNHNIVKSGYSSYGKSDYYKERNLYLNTPYEKLLEIARQKGLNLTNLNKIDKIERHSAVATSLAQKSLNKYSSTNMYEATIGLMDVVTSMNARLKTQNINELLTEHSRRLNREDETSFMESSAKLNIKGDRFLSDSMGNFRNFGKRWFNSSLVGGKHYNILERELKQKFENELNNVNREYDFKYRKDKDSYEYRYRKIGDKFYRERYDEKSQKKIIEEVKEKEIKIEDGKTINLGISDIYDEYLYKELESIGSFRTLGTLSLAYQMQMLRATFSGIKIAAGYLNRRAGKKFISILAVTGIYGFDTTNDLASQKFLTFRNSKYFLGKFDRFNWLKFLYNKRAKQMDTLDLFGKKLNIFGNALTEAKTDIDGSVTSKIGTFYNDLAFDSSINLPEWKNNMQLLLNLMQNTFLADGVTPIFNAKTQELVYVPGTLRLQDKYRYNPDGTENTANILNWEKFDKTDVGKAPQTLMIAKFKIVKNIANGPYDNDSKLLIDGNISTKLLTQNLKWMIGNGYQQAGAQKINIATGQLDFKGNKRILMEHAPTLFVHLTIMNGTASAGIVTTGLAAMIGFSPLGLFLFSTTFLTGASYVYRRLRNKNKKNLFNDITKNTTTREDLLIALDHGLEVAQRCINVFPQFLNSNRTVGKLFKNNVNDNGIVQKFSMNVKGLSKVERDALSASAQEIANKFNTFLSSSTQMLVAYGLYLLYAGNDDDDEEKKRKNQIAFQNLEYLFNLITNTKNKEYTDMEQWSNPELFWDSSSAAVFKADIEKGLNVFKEIDGRESSFSKYQSGKITGEDFVKKAALPIITVLGGSKSNTKDVLGDFNDFIGDERVYKKRDWFDNLIIESKQDPNDLANKITKQYRDKYREDIKDNIRNAFMDSGKELLDDEVSTATENWFKEHEYYKKNGEKYTYEELAKQENWQKLEENVNNMKNENLLDLLNKRSSRRTRRLNNRRTRRLNNSRN